VIRVVPCTVTRAKLIVAAWHRHVPDIQGGLFAAAIAVDGEIHGVAIAGNPSRVWQGTGRILISRVATDGVRNGCSRLYAALARAAEALGYTEAWTYTLPEEPGSSLLAAGFEDMGVTDWNADWDRPARRRPPPRVDGPKRRWRRLLRPERKAERRAA
jgi:hypothetical protein